MALSNDFRARANAYLGAKVAAAFKKQYTAPVTFKILQLHSPVECSMHQRRKVKALNVQHSQMASLFRYLTTGSSQMMAQGLRHENYKCCGARNSSAVAYGCHGIHIPTQTSANCSKL